jgi:nucleoside-diphosphate-sugar epimerase
MIHKSVLIAGGAGFLGSYLCDYYVEQGANVVCADNLSSGAMRNIKHLSGQPSFIFVKCDIVNNLPKRITGRKYDLIINMASPASPPHYQRLAL